MKKLALLLAFLVAPVGALAQTVNTYYTLPSIAALKALTTRPGVVEVLDSNPGVFNWSTTACSAADDTFQVTPTSGPTGCYTRMATPYAVGKAVYSSVLNLKGQGAKCDGSTDDSAIIQSTVNTAISTGAAIYVPSGICVSTAQITGTVSNTQFVSIYGEGASSRFKFTNASSGGFNFTLGGVSANQVGRANLQNFRIVAGAANTTQAAIKLSWSAYTANANQSFLVENVTVSPDTFGTNVFAKGLHIDKAYNGRIENFTFQGATAFADAGIYVNNSISVVILNPDITYATAGVHGTTGDGGVAQAQGEGLLISGGNIYHTTKPLLIDGLSSGANNYIDVVMSGVAITAEGTGSRAADLTQVNQSFILNNLIYQDGAQPAFDLKTVANTQIAGNYLVLLGAGTSPAIKLSSSSNNNNISNNIIGGYTTGILFNGTTDGGNVYSGNQFNTVGTAVTDNATVKNANLGNCSTTAGSVTSCSIGTSLLVWNGAKIGLAYGGTNADLSATGGASQVLKQTSPGGAVTVGQLSCSDLSNGSASCSNDTTNASNISSGTLAAARLPASLGSGVTAAPGLLSAAAGSFGTAAFAATGTSGGTVPLLNGANTWAASQSFGAGLLITGGSFAGNGQIYKDTNQGLAIASVAGAVNDVNFFSPNGASSYFTVPTGAIYLAMGAPIGVKTYTVSTLPSTSATGRVTGARANVTDATSCTFLGALTGGASTFCPVVYNGSAWVGG